MNKTAVLFNPSAGKGRAAQNRRALQKCLKELMQAKGRRMPFLPVYKEVPNNKIGKNGVNILSPTNDPCKLEGYVGEAGEFQKNVMQVCRDLGEDLIPKKIK